MYEKGENGFCSKNFRPFSSWLHICICFYEFTISDNCVESKKLTRVFEDLHNLIIVYQILESQWSCINCNEKNIQLVNYNYKTTP